MAAERSRQRVTGGVSGCGCRRRRRWGQRSRRPAPGRSRRWRRWPSSCSGPRRWPRRRRTGPRIRSWPWPSRATAPRWTLPAPGFQLTDQNGQPVSLASLRGKVVLMTFLDPVCTTDCPIIGAEMKEAGVLLGVGGQGRGTGRGRGQPDLPVGRVHPGLRPRGRAEHRAELAVPDRVAQPAQPGLAAVRGHRGEPARGRDVGAQRPGRGHRPDRAHPRGGGRRPRARHGQHPVLVLRAAQPVRPPARWPSS